MPNRSIKSQVLMTLITAMFVISIVVGGISIFEIDKLILEQFTATMQSDCEKEAITINNTLKDIEATINTMKKYAVFELSTEDEAIDGVHMSNIKKVLTNIANDTEIVEGVYFTAEKDGADDFHLVKVDGKLSTSNIVKIRYDEQNRWQKPYYNKTFNGYLSAYETPVQVSDSILGYVGIELDCNVITNIIDGIKINESGFAYLIKDGKIEYHKEYERGVIAPDMSSEYFEVSQPLDNGTEIVFAASYGDMNQKKNAIVFKIWGIVILLAFMFMLMTVTVVKKIVKPLKNLAEASEEISKGNYNIDIEKATTKEIASLSRAFEKMAQDLRENDMYMHRIAYRDPLTKLRNTAAYKAWVDEFDVEIMLQDTVFGVVVLDVNGLKEANDSLGHDVGDKLIFTAAQIISEVFRKSPVFRIGGDEFVVVLTGEDLAHKDELMEEMHRRCNSGRLKADGEVLTFSIAKGVAFYDKESDNKFADVFKRADDAMYEDKRRIKAGK